MTDITKTFSRRTVIKVPGKLSSYKPMFSDKKISIVKEIRIATDYRSVRNAFNKAYAKTKGCEVE